MAFCSQAGIFSIGVVNPDKTEAGMMKMKEPRRACCMVVESEETTSPTPTMATVKQNRDRTNDGTDPRMGMPNQFTAPALRIKASINPRNMPGTDFTIRNAPVEKGASSSRPLCR